MSSFRPREIVNLQQDLADEGNTYPYHILARRLKLLTPREMKTVKSYYREYKETGDPECIELLDTVIAERAETENDPWE